MNLAKILNKNNNFREIITNLEPFKEKFSTNQEMQRLLAIAYYNEGMQEKALECYKLMNPSLIPENQLEAYGQLLEKQGKKKEAFKIYLTLGKIYGNQKAYIKAEKLAPDKKTRMSILAQMAGKTSDPAKLSLYKMKLGMGILKDGNQKEGLQTVLSVNVDKLTKPQADEYLEMLPYFENEKILIRECLSILNKYYSEDIQKHQQLMNSLLKAGRENFCRDFFRQEYALYPKNPIANFMCAKFQTSPKIKKQLYLKALALSPDFYEAALELGIFYINEQNWKNAVKLFFQCEKIRPRETAPRYYSTIAKMKITGSGNELKRYEGFLKSRKIPEIEILKQMVILSQYLKDDKYALIYLKQAQKVESLNTFCVRQTIRMKLIYQTLKESDFTDKNINDPIIKKYYIIYLLGKGEYRKIMALPTKKEDFPELWKVFICWKQEIPSWEQNSFLLISRNSSNPLLTNTAKLWLRQISPNDAVNVLDRIDYIDKPLLCIMIAEQYKKDGENLNSKLFFRKALTYPTPNIYIQVANYLRKH